MSLEQFVSDFEAAIDLPGVSISAGTDFKAMNDWDSLCVLNVIAMIDEVHGITVTGRQIESVTTVADLHDLVCKLKG